MHSVWKRFGNVRNFVDPFFGSGASILCRPEPFEGIETVNDLDGMISNFWRALQADPDAVAKWADWPVDELSLHARHLWLVNEGRRHVERLRTEPDYFDAKIAGWWVLGCCQWIGSGWCEHPEWKHLGSGMGIHRPSQKLPHLGDAGRGIHRPSQKLPHLGDAGRGEIYHYFALLSERFRRVRICCGDWSRVCGPSPTTKQGLTAVFLDPPYSPEHRDATLYACESDVTVSVRQWCLEHGNDRLLRIAICGYAGEGHESLEQSGWTVISWKAKGGYGSQADGAGRENCQRERIWYSPHCLKPEDHRSLFDGA